LNKKMWMIPFSTVMLFGLAGCAGNDKSGVNTQSVNPVGYYSNENHPSRGNGLLIDNDGPVTELMDHLLGGEGRKAAEQKRRYLQIRDKNGNPPNPTVPLAASDKNFFQRDNRFSTSDFNYHGHMSRQYGNAGVVTKSSFQDRVTSKIRTKVAAVDNVRSVRSVGYGNNIIVSVRLIDDSREEQTKKAIRKAVKPYADGKDIQVMVDDGALGRDRNFDNRIQRSPNKGPNIIH
jgi:spore cortex protein